MTTTESTPDIAGCCTVSATEEPASPAATDDCACCSISADDVSGGAAIDEVKAEETTSEVDALRATGFRLLLEAGRPVGVTEWAEAAGLDEDAAFGALDLQSGRAQLDQSGRLVGIAGLTIEPTRHELDIAGRKRWTWCALDAVGILGALGATGSVLSTDPRTGDSVEIDFIDGLPQGDATLFILGGFDGGSVREEWCPLVNFFTTPDDAEAWVAESGVDGDIVSVQQIADEAAAMWRPVTRPSTAPAE